MFLLFKAILNFLMLPYISTNSSLFLQTVNKDIQIVLSMIFLPYIYKKTQKNKMLLVDYFISLL